MATRVNRRWIGRVAAGVVALGVPVAAFAGTVTLTSGPIAISSSLGVASPYPSTLNVPSPGVVQNVKVTLTNLNVFRPDAADILLQHGATNVIILSDAGDTQPSSGSTLNFDKGGTDVSATACSPPAVTAVLPPGPGPYKPVNCGDNNGDTPSCNEASPDDFPSPGPGVIAAGVPNLGAFDGASQQGDWKLFVYTDCAHFGFGEGMDSWTLTITNANPTAVTLSGLEASRTAAGVAIRWRTADERDALGYAVWRVSPGKAAKVGPLVPAKQSGRPLGASYRVVDRTAPRAAAVYRLRVVGVDGSKHWLGTVALSAPLGSN